MEVDLKDVLVASGKLEQMADAYEGVIDKLQRVAGQDAAAFEDWSLHDAWAALRDTFWLYAAETQDHLNATSVALIHYINAICEQDDENAKDLFDAVVDHNAELWNDTQEYGRDLGEALPAPDLDNPDGPAYEVPQHEAGDLPPQRG